MDVVPRCLQRGRCAQERVSQGFYHRVVALLSGWGGKGFFGSSRFGPIREPLVPTPGVGRRRLVIVCSGLEEVYGLSKSPVSVRRGRGFPSGRWTPTTRLSCSSMAHIMSTGSLPCFRRGGVVSLVLLPFT